jgi:hypothetical protein
MDAQQRRTLHNRGELTIDQLLDVVERLEARVASLERENQGLRQRLAQYEPVEEGAAGDPPSEGGKTDFSLAGEERRKQRRRKKKSPGRRPTALKFAQAQQSQDVYPEGVDPAACRLVRERAVWRLIEQRAVLVGYRIHAAPGGGEPPIPGVPPRCEYGIEILVAAAYLQYIVGMSVEKVGSVLQFFCGLPLGKSQLDALGRQLAKHWEGEFEHLCDLLTTAAVVGMDETGWRVGQENCSLWRFASQLHRVLVFGCRKDEETLEILLPQDAFQGVGVSDDAAVYRYRFAQAQKCWPHLLRKAIRLAVLYPAQKKYREFLDALLALFYDAKRAAADGRLGAAGRRERVAQFSDRLFALVDPHLCLFRKIPAGTSPPEREFTNLANELFRLAMQDELFTFVLDPAVPADNNESERGLRPATQDRKAGRTNHTAAGARRRTIIVSVLESLRANLKAFTLSAVIDEVQNWMSEGVSRFRRQLEKRLDALGQPPPVVPSVPRLAALFGK